MADLYCSNCGKLIEDKSNFCKFCGASQHVEAEPAAKPQESSVDPGDLVPRQHLSGRAVWSFVIGYITYTGIILLLLVIGVILNPLIFISAIGFYFFALTIFASLVHGYFYYEVNETGFGMEYGILQKRHVSIPFEKIHNVNINRSVIDRMLGLARVEIETSGSSFHEKSSLGGNVTAAEGMLPGLTLQQAQKVHDVLLKYSDGE